MIDALLRKASQVVDDPVLRRWMVARAVGRETAPPSLARNVPPYLDPAAIAGVDATPSRTCFEAGADVPPDRAIELPLPGERVRLRPGDASSLFDRRFDDLETTLAVQRFAWLPLLGQSVPAGWVAAVWRAWMDRHGNPDDGWAWHPYTAAERAINVLDHARHAGLPEPRDRTVGVLAAHGPAIAARLEYFGDHYTSNHLSNNGRGLHRIGLELGIPDLADLGAKILLAEAKRIFLPSGILREGSSHYHFLLTRNYADAWLAARRHRRPEAAALADIARRALAAAPYLVLGGGLALIGDISPDCPPDFLLGLADPDRRDSGWTGALDEESGTALSSLGSEAEAPDPAALAGDGWARFDGGPWSALFHAAPSGWPPMPGHGHQDTGSFELHHGVTPLFIDPGRGSYGETGEAMLYAGAAVHNGLRIDGRDPYPRNRPYYGDAFRTTHGGEPPAFTATANGMVLTYGGSSLTPAIDRVRREWTFDDASMTLTDRVDGRGTHGIVRRLVTPHRVDREGDGLLRIETGTAAFRLGARGDVAVAPFKRWTAYGESAPATRIEVSSSATLPYETSLRIQAL